MKPKNFRQSNVVYKAPEGMDEDSCGELNVYSDPETGLKISLWSMGFWERLKFLFHGKIWLGVMSEAHPMVWIISKNNIFDD